jgi:homogentisate 1,2-dioxygenase
MACVDKDQSDPTVSCVLTAKSKIPGVAISEFLAFTPKWNVTSDTFRPPVSPKSFHLSDLKQYLYYYQYYHRNMSSEVMGLLYGVYGGSSHSLEPGGLSFEPSFMPHGGRTIATISSTIITYN